MLGQRRASLYDGLAISFSPMAPPKCHFLQLGVQSPRSAASLDAWRASSLRALSDAKNCPWGAPKPVWPHNFVNLLNAYNNFCK